MQRVNRLTLNSLIVAGFSGLSVLAGFAFDVLIAARFGLGSEADAYFAAVTLPIVVLTALLTASQSVLVVALSPDLTPRPPSLKGRGRVSPFSPLQGREGSGGKEHRRGDERGLETQPNLFSSLLNLAGLIGILLAGVGVLAAPLLARLLSPGFDAASLALTASLTQVLFLRAPAAAMVEILRPVLLARQHFTLASAGYLIDSLVALLGLFFLPARGVPAAAWALTLGAWVELGWLAAAFALTHSGVYRPRIGWRDPALRQVGRSLAAPLGGLLFRQGVILAERWFGSLLGPGSVAALGYANKIIKVLGGVIFDSVNTASLPSLTAALAAGIRTTAEREWRRLLVLSSLAAVPLGVGLALFSRPFVRLLFSSSSRDLGAVTLAQMATLLAIYSLAIIPLGPFRAQQSYLYAARRPASVGWLLFLATIVTLLLDWPLVRLAGANGLGFSFALGLAAALGVGFVTIRRQISQLVN